MTWAAPEFAWLLLLLIPAGGLRSWSAARQRRDLRRLEASGARLDPRPAGLRSRRALLLGVFLLLVMALCRPQWGQAPMSLESRALDLLIVLDVSRSMLTDDLLPDRLTQAKTAVARLLPRLRGDRIGLIAFAGTAFTVCPPTTDYDAFAGVLAESGPDFLPLAGTSLANALREAGRSLSVTGGKSLILLSDGEDHDDETLAAARALREAGVTLHVVAVGSAAGGLIPLPEGAFHKDRHGRLVRSRLHEATLRDLAVGGGGRLFNLAKYPDALERLYALIHSEQKQTTLSATRQPLKERFQIPLALALLLLFSEPILGGRRRP